MLKDLVLLSPELTLVSTVLLLVLIDLFTVTRKMLPWLAVAGFLTTFVLALSLWSAPAQSLFNGLLTLDRFAVFFKLLIISTATLVIMVSGEYLDKNRCSRGEFYALVILSALGLMLLVSATDIITVFIALELSGISLYALVSYLKDEKSIEAGLKYLLLGAVASAVLLYGMVLLFGLSGKTSLTGIAGAVKSAGINNLGQNPALLLALVMVAAGFGFKIASFPFQMWVPDVYEGAPTPVTAYLSVASKCAGFAVIIRVFTGVFAAPAWLSMDWGTLFAVLAAITMTVGNIAALSQINIKRMLGYSSIAQAGYLMVGLAAIGISGGANVLGQAGLLFFVLSYFRPRHYQIFLDDTCNLRFNGCNSNLVIITITAHT